MLLLTDGEDLEGQGLVAAKQAAAAGITIDAVGVGSHEGELVPARDASGRAVDVVRDESGQPVRSRLDEPGLRAITAAAHGTYRAFGSDGQGLERLYRDALAGRAQLASESRTHRVYSERFDLALGLGLLAMLLDSLLGLPWRKSRRAPARRMQVAAAVVAGALCLFGQGHAHASAWSAQRAYAAKDFTKAMQEFGAASARAPKDARLAFNAGDAAYKAGRYDVANTAFTRALATAAPAVRQHVLYNQGDALYRLGEASLATDRGQTIERWKAAVSTYEKALALDPKDADAHFNRDFVKHKLDELQKQPQKPQDGKQKQDQDQDKRSANQKTGDGASSASKEGAAKNAGPTGKQPSPQSTSGAPGGAPVAAAPSGGLSEQDARSLLGALRGEERDGARLGTGAARPADEPVKKDW
jgi:Ca-activated chloride channel family protein